jgi:two-component system, chemotaxis family, chemotaxis protein CheY
VVGEAPTAHAALTAMERGAAPDLVCLDVEMPGLDGLTLLKRIREEHEGVRVLMITGQSTLEVVKEALALGARGFVVKPFTASKVLDAIRQALA